MGRELGGEGLRSVGDELKGFWASPPYEGSFVEDGRREGMS